MATPSSSATSPSPPLAYLQPMVPMSSNSQEPSSSSISPLSSSTDPVERETRKKAVQKFLARAELSNVTRTLRSRLSYASSKTTSSVPPVTFGDYEAQSSSVIPGARSYAAKRKAPSQPVVNTIPSPLRKGSLGPTTPRAPTLNGNVGASTSSAAGTTEPNTNTLFTSILAPPPPDQARTILNVNDPPVAAPVRPPMSPKVRSGKDGKVTRSIAESTRAHAKRSRQDKRKDKGKSRKAVDADGDVDMEAAATLTSLLLNHRPSIASTSSPRSSIDGGSEPGSSFSQQPHSARSSFASVVSSAPSTVASTYNRSNTPPRSSNTPVQQQTTPHPAPTDNEAADLMLFLATSPSPARTATSKNARDAAAFRALNPTASTNNGNMMRAKGRVLFPTQGESNDDPISSRRNSRSGIPRSDSFAGSSMSNIGAEMSEPRTIARFPPSPMNNSASHFPHQQQPPTDLTHLLPPPSLPVQHPSSNLPPSSSSLRQELSSRAEHPGAGSQGDYGYNEHRQGSRSQQSHPANSQKANMGLRADVGRKMVEEEQIRLQQKRRPDERSLDGGIDLVRT